MKLLREVTKEMIRKWDMDKVDWMGYKLASDDIFTFHHLIVPNREGGPYAMWNGAILCGKSAHSYLHVVEAKDYDRFLYITSLLIDENAMGKLDLATIIKIDEALKVFEVENQGKRTRKGKALIKSRYMVRDYSSLK